MPDAAWCQPVTVLKGVGPHTARSLSASDINTLFDLVLHLPRRYEDKTCLTPKSDIRPGNTIYVEGDVVKSYAQFGRRRSWVVVIESEVGEIYLRFFQYSKGMGVRFSPGTRMRCYGVVRESRHGLELIHPQTAPVNADSPFSKSLTAVYPPIEGVGQAVLRRSIRQALSFLHNNDDDDRVEFVELLPSIDDASFVKALRVVHCGLETTHIEAARRRLALDELLGVYLHRLRACARLRGQRAPSVIPEGALVKKFLSNLPFTLTLAQQRVVKEIEADLAKPYPMQRLLQGDVGCGKTLVAALAALHVVAANKQVSMMAPTELLAEQHFETLKKWFAPLGIETGFLTASVSTSDRRELREKAATGVPLIVVGTHALFQNDSEFSDLGLVIVDEQHRFGVAQRVALRRKGEADGACPHMLVMSATPIPRTLSMTRYADLDVSVIDQVPQGRIPVETAVVASNRRDEVASRIAESCGRGEQAFWVCPSIEVGEDESRIAVTEIVEYLRRFDGRLVVDVIHGRMESAEKAAAMTRFCSGESQVLVATTVIEVGVDVPRATRIVIENAERMGLAQLHQLRGRVGRGALPGSCVLLYRAPLSDEARSRLGVLRNCHDGFVIAEHDLSLRGEGEVVGRRQSGLKQFKIADIERDADLSENVPQIAQHLLRTRPNDTDRLVRRWVHDDDARVEV